MSKNEPTTTSGIWPNSNDGTSSSVSSVEPSPHGVPRVEGYLYYAGLDPNGRGSKLIYRTSDDKSVQPEGPRAYKRLMKPCPVPEDHELGQGGRWDRIHDQVVELLDKGGIKLTSVDLVQFTWLDKADDRGIEKEEGDDDVARRAERQPHLRRHPTHQAIEDGKRHTTNPTIWVGVLPNTLTGAVAHESATEILGLLKELGIARIDVAYRESVVKFLHGPDLFAPVSDLDPLKDVIYNLSTPLSLPIAGRKMTMQGTLGCYFRVGDDLYAVTARQNVFALKGDNEEYNYVGNGTLNDTVDSLEKWTRTLMRRVEAGGDDAQKSAGELAETQDQLAKIVTRIGVLKACFVDVKTRWSKPKDHVIGYVVWAPPIGAGVPPHRYTRDVYAMKLNKNKFRKSISHLTVRIPGPKISPAKFKALMYDRVDVPFGFEHPEKGLIIIIYMCETQWQRIRRVIKRGFTMNITVSTLSRLMSHDCKYFVTGNLDSVEVAILPHDNDSIASPGVGTNSSDITFATLIEWVWDFIKDKFPDADLYFDDLEGFLADVI
ncbi:hypothetical protein BOTBODRAFT_59543 [Botryobasidium botryosum FD-172 SS1]|uniref:Uncharacterized protein n=1 Tax=Botryobasidium botryosum (strain FD-172 SS1) TaxID=930990 RepID=A0A067LXX6_BOTB1|nr:hypothetical protein BOTBODRAFT_59543 [Botryobasidium botryosum FD-172 SS1]